VNAPLVDAMTEHFPATIEDLYRYTGEGKAELVDGRIVPLGPVGDMYGSAAGSVAFSLAEFRRATCALGRVYTSTVVFLCDLPHRKSISPDASWYTGPRSGVKFLPQAPDFACEIRSSDEHSPEVEARIAAKRVDYFAIGTEVVWDVDLHDDDVIRVYRSENPESFTIYRHGEFAEAEPAVPGLTMPVDELFE
jgi:Uma2 family endonuclease